MLGADADRLIPEPVTGYIEFADTKPSPRTGAEHCDQRKPGCGRDPDRNPIPALADPICCRASRE